MSFDTTDINKSRQNLNDYDEIWLFAYGSLIYKVDFPFLEKQVASINGWQRRFWQGSHDHRGTAQRPGRVATLIEDKTSQCIGMAFKVSHEVFEHLDHREKNGYLRHEEALQLASGEKKQGLLYIADEHNQAYLGPKSELDIAKQIHNCEGPSGKNADYVFELAQSLRNLNTIDDHVFSIERHLIQLAKVDKPL